MNKHQEIAAKRKAEIEYSKARIERKLADAPKDQRAKAWKKRLSEYDESMQLIEFTLETGRPVKFKGAETEGGTVIEPPNGNINMEGK